ncbi:MAG: bifunctional metallophosphatase/5'-nucleotidase, partial [Erysipelotrichia bacterium]|nr:bifunctional metallophosphatase/5'-nucleotidase [Erysipelotrichia bacterium]
MIRIPIISVSIITDASVKGLIGAPIHILPDRKVFVTTGMPFAVNDILIMFISGGHTMIIIKKLMTVLLTAAMFAGCTAAPTSANSETAAVILFTNDVHGRIINDTSEPSWGLARVAREKQKLIEEGYDTFLFSAGDDTQGEPIVNLDMGVSVIRFMSEAGYDLMQAGNHEFDYGSDQLLKNAQTADFPILAANITRTSDGTLLLDANHIFETSSGMKIGVFGLETPQTMTGTSPKNVEGLSFAQGEDLYQCAQNQIDELKKQGCDLIVCLGHLGVYDSASPNRSIDVIENTKGINVLIDGHSHTEVNEMVNDTLLVQTGCNGHNLGRMTIKANGHVEAKLIPAADQDAELATEISDYNKEINQTFSEVIASSAVDLDGAKEDLRSRETNLGDFTADAVMYAASANSAEHVDACILNGGSIRDSIAKGDISWLTIKSVFPFGNSVVTLKVTGAELLEALEAATFSLPDALVAFPQVSGLEFTVDTSVAYENGEEYPNSSYYKPARPGSRVTIQSVGGRNFNPDDLYVI